MLLQTNEQAAAQGDNIVADGWAGAFIPPLQHSHNHNLSIENARFHAFKLERD